MRRWKRSPQAGIPTAFTTAKKPRAKPRKLEDPIHIVCFNWLDVNIDGVVYHIPNGLDGGNEVVFIRGLPVPKAALAWKKLEKMGARSGVLDLIIHWLGADGIGRTVYFEIKSEEGTLSGNQKDFITDITRCGIPHYVIRSLAECQAAARAVGLPFKKFTPCVARYDSASLSA